MTIRTTTTKVEATVHLFENESTQLLQLLRIISGYALEMTGLSLIPCLRTRIANFPPVIRRSSLCDPV